MNRKTLEYYGGVYHASSDGVIWSYRGNKKARKPSVGKDGYHRVILSSEGVNTTCYVHRLVWEEFHGEIPSGMTVNHRDMDKGNNALENLELMTQGENLAHARANRKWSHSKKEVHIYRKKLLAVDWERDGYSTFAEAAKSVVGSSANIHKACKTGKVCYGYVWKDTE